MSDSSVHRKITQVMAELRVIPKTGRNQHQSYAFRSIDEVLRRLQPLLVSHGLTMIPRVLDVRTEVRQTSKGGNVNWCFLTVEYVITDDETGSSTLCVVVGESADTQDKSSGKAMSQALKQAVFQTFVVPSEEADPDAYSPSPFHEADSLAEAMGHAPTLTKTQGERVKELFDETEIEQEYRVQFANDLLGVHVSSAGEFTAKQGDELIEKLTAVAQGAMKIARTEDGRPYPEHYEESEEPWD